MDEQTKEVKRRGYDKLIQKLPNILIEQIDSAYIGKPDKCMCGCSGTYSYSSMNREKSSKSRGYKINDDEVNDKRVKFILDRMRKFQANGVYVLDDYIYSVYIGTRQYTIYLFKNSTSPS